MQNRAVALGSSLKFTWPSSALHTAARAPSIRIVSQPAELDALDVSLERRWRLAASIWTVEMAALMVVVLPCCIASGKATGGKVNFVNRLINFFLEGES